MSKVLLLVSLALLATVPAVSGQGHTVDIEIEDLPASVRSNGTSAVLQFNVTATVAGAAPCLAAPTASAQYTIVLTANVVNSSGNHTSANVNPRSTTIAGPVLLPVTGGNGFRTIPATLIINAGPYMQDSLNSTVKVTAAMVEGNGGCTGVPAAQSDVDEQTVQASFEPVRGFGAADTPGNEMPGPAAGLLLVALVALVAARRQA